MNDDFNKFSPQIRRFIKEKAPDFTCNVCNKDDFSLVGGFHRHEVQESVNKLKFPGISIAAATIICNNCGNIYDFSLRHMNLLEETTEFIDGEKNGKKKK